MEITWPSYYLATFLAFLCAIHLIRGLLKSLRSPLKTVPGPWYAPLTTIHLRYLFSTGTIWKLVERSHRKYGDVVRLGPRQVWVADKAAIKEILVKTDLPKVAMYAEISRDRFNPGLFGEIRHDPHKRLKRFLSPAFTVNYVDNLECFFENTVQDLLHNYARKIDEDPVYHAKTGIEVDLMDDLHKLALDIMGECSFGKGFGRINPNRAMMMENGVDEGVWTSIPRAIFDGQATRYRDVYVKRFFRAFGVERNVDWPAEMITAIDAVVQRRKREVDSVDRRDLLQHLIEEGKRPSDNSPMTTRDIVDQTAEILLAGSETTSGTIGCLFLELARNPRVRAKLLASLPARSYDDNQLMPSRTVRTDPRYEYLEACIKENLRMHPIASEMGRRTGDKWIKLAGYDLPPHTVVSASYRDLHRNEKYWPQPNHFWPERWLPEERREGAPAPDMDAYYPFSAGKHSCIGINFAWAEMRIVAASILERYDVVEVPGQEVDFRQYITMQFHNGRWSVTLRPRA